MAFSILLQNVFYIHYKRHSYMIQETEQYEEKKYTLEDYYKGKEEPDDDEE